MGFAGRVAASFFLLASGGIARGEPRLEITWQAPPDCPDQGALMRAVHKHLRAQPPATDKILEGTISVRRGATEKWEMHLHLRIDGAEGDRDVEAARCVDLLDAAALIVVLALDPNAGLAAPSPDVPAPIEPEPAPPPAAIVSSHEGEPVAPARPGPGVPIRWALRVEAAGDTGDLPGFGPALAVAAAFLRGGLRLELGAAYSFPRRTMLDSNPSLGGELDLMTGLLRACHSVLHPAVSLCAGVEAGVLAGTGVGVPGMNRSGTWVAPILGPFFTWNIWRSLRIAAHLEVSIPLRRPRFTLDGVSEAVYQPSVLSGRLGAGIEWVF